MARVWPPEFGNEIGDGRPGGWLGPLFVPKAHSGEELLDLAPMLAHRGLSAAIWPAWAAEPKLDGWRPSWRSTLPWRAGVLVRPRRGHADHVFGPGRHRPARRWTSSITTTS
jgi:hypothetical protein